MSSMLKEIAKHQGRCATKEGTVARTFHVVEEDMVVVVEEEDIPEVAAEAHGVGEVYLVQDREVGTEDEAGLDLDHEVSAALHHPKPLLRVPETILDPNHDLLGTHHDHDHDPNQQDAHVLDLTTRTTN